MIPNNFLAFSITRRDRNVPPIGCVYDSRNIPVPTGYRKEYIDNHLALRTKIESWATEKSNIVKLRTNLLFVTKKAIIMVVSTEGEL